MSHTLLNVGPKEFVMMISMVIMLSFVSGFVFSHGGYILAALVIIPPVVLVLDTARQAIQQGWF